MYQSHHIHIICYCKVLLMKWPLSIYFGLWQKLLKRHIIRNICRVLVKFTALFQIFYSLLCTCFESFTYIMLHEQSKINLFCNFSYLFWLIMSDILIIGCPWLTNLVSCIFVVIYLWFFANSNVSKAKLLLCSDFSLSLQQKF